MLKMLNVFANKCLGKVFEMKIDSDVQQCKYLAKAQKHVQ